MDSDDGFRAGDAAVEGDALERLEPAISGPGNFVSHLWAGVVESIQSLPAILVVLVR